MDFIHFPIIYYFHSGHRRSSLAYSLPALLRFAEDGSAVAKGQASEQRLAPAEGLSFMIGICQGETEFSLPPLGN